MRGAYGEAQEGDVSDSVRQETQIFTGNANPGLAMEITDYLGITPGRIKVGRFCDGEINVNIEESVRGADIFLIRSSCYPANEEPDVELLIRSDGRPAPGPRRGASPPSCRMYRLRPPGPQVERRGANPAKLLANLITAGGVSRVVTMDVHAGQDAGLLRHPGADQACRRCRSWPNISRDSTSGRVVVVSPDVGGVTRARDFAQPDGSLFPLPSSTSAGQRPTSHES